MQIRDRIKELRRVPASELLPNPKNWRTHPVEQQDALRGVLAEVGYADALIARETPDGLMLVDGHLRAETTPDSSVPVLVLDIDEAEADLMLATLDPLAAMAGRDEERLSELLATVSSDNATVNALLQTLANGYEPLTIPEPEPPDEGFDVDEAMDDAEADDYEPTVQRGEVWSLGQHRLMCGDNMTDFPLLMGGIRAHLVVTSPPYNQDIQSFHPSGMQRESPAFVHRMASAYMDTKDEATYRKEQLILLEELAHSHLRPDASIFYNHKIRYRDKHIVHPLEWLLKLPFHIRQEIIWNRGSSITMNARMLIPADERVYWIRIGEDFTYNDEIEIKSWSTVWNIGARNEYQVSAPFPNEIPIRCIRIASNPGDLVIDPFVGSGTTIMAAERLGRRCYAMEIEPRYCDVAIKRWEDYTGEKAVQV